MAKSRKKLVVSLIVGAAVIASPFIANKFDEAISPQAVDYGLPHAPAIPDSENGYYPYLAMNGPGDGDGMDYAKSWIAEQRAAAQANRAANLPEPVQRAGKLLCDFLTSNCLPQDAAAAAELRDQLAQLTTELRRYDTLLGYVHYEDVLDYPLDSNTNLAPMVGAVTGQKAWLLQAAVDFDGGNVDQALAAIGKDIKLQRNVLVGSKTMLAKMVATNCLLRDLQVVTQWMEQRRDALAPKLPVLRALIEQLTPAELSLAAVLDTEFGFQRSVFLETLKGTALYKTNATFNMAYAQHQQIKAAAMQPAPALLDQPPHPAKKGISLLDLYDNPIGKSLLQIGSADYTSHALRMHDLDGYFRLVALVLEARIQKVAPAAVPDFLKSVNGSLHDPYTQQPMKWNATGGTMSFEFHGSTNVRKGSGSGGQISLAL